MWPGEAQPLHNDTEDLGEGCSHMTLLAAARQHAPLRRDLQSVTYHCESPSPQSYLMPWLSQGCSTQANDFSWATEPSSAGAYSRKEGTDGGLDPHMQPHRCSLQANQCIKPTMKQGRLLPLPAPERFRPDVRRVMEKEQKWKSRFYFSFIPTLTQKPGGISSG